MPLQLVHFVESTTTKALLMASNLADLYSTTYGTTYTPRERERKGRGASGLVCTRTCRFESLGQGLDVGD